MVRKKKKEKKMKTIPGVLPIQAVFTLGGGRLPPRPKEENDKPKKRKKTVRRELRI